MERREFIKHAGRSIAGALLRGAALGASREPGGPPNFLFILTDQQRWDAVGAYGDGRVFTPNIDRIARDGVRFENCYAAQAVCSPSRASILSGLFPHAHRVYDNIYGVEDCTADPAYNLSVIWPRLLQQAGYHTGWIGKWHLGDSAPACFDEWHGFNSLLPHWLGEPYESEYRSDHETDIGLKYLEENRGRPFALCQSYYPPHTDYTAPKRFWEYYEDSDLSPMEYYAACSDIDWNVGRLMSKLRELDLLENTFVVFTSDHGDHFGSRPGGGNKRGAYDDCARVPLIFHHPTLARKGLVRNELTSNVDLMPSLLEAARLDIPEGLHGRSLLPLVRGRNPDWRSAVMIENLESVPTGSDREEDDLTDSRGVRTDRWKLILRDRLSVRAANLRELYDLSADPGEQTSIYGPDRSTDVEPILGELESWARQVGDDTGLKLASACRAELSEAGQP